MFFSEDRLFVGGIFSKLSLEAKTFKCPYLFLANNVYQLLKLANRFQVDFLRKRCEAHIIHCVDMPLMERLIYADAYHLDKLKVNIFIKLK